MQEGLLNVLSRDIQFYALQLHVVGGLPCELAGIIESPLVNGYRNKCEFSVGYSVHQKPTVGFLLGNFRYYILRFVMGCFFIGLSEIIAFCHCREGVTAVEEPTNCPNVSKIASTYALVFQEFLQDSSLPIWNRFNNTGFWRQLTVSLVPSYLVIFDLLDLFF